MITTKFCGTQTADQDFNLKTLEEAILELRSLPKNYQWLLVDPNAIYIKAIYHPLHTLLCVIILSID